MKKIALTQGMFAVVDDEDFEELNKHKWYAHLSGRTYYADREIAFISKRKKGIRRVRNKKVSMHRVIMNPPEKMVCDHIDGNGLNNQRNNLRICTQKDNSRNGKKPITNTSGFKGVYKDRGRKNWRVRMSVSGKSVSSGSFRNKILAAKKYDEMAKRYFGEFAKLNFPDELPPPTKEEIEQVRGYLRELGYETAVGEEKKKMIEDAVKRAFVDYGECLKKLGND